MRSEYHILVVSYTGNIEIYAANWPIYNAVIIATRTKTIPPEEVIELRKLSRQIRNLRALAS